jgi:hypothetical protein
MSVYSSDMASVTCPNQLMFEALSVPKRFACFDFLFPRSPQIVVGGGWSRLVWTRNPPTPPYEFYMCCGCEKIPKNISSLFLSKWQMFWSKDQRRFSFSVRCIFFSISNVVQRENSTQKMSRAKVFLWICPVSSHNNENEKKGSKINFKFGNIIKFIFRVYF